MSVRRREWITRSGEPRQAWVVDYADGAGKRRLRTFARKRQAVDFAATTLVEVKEGTHTPASVSVTVATAAELWIKHCEAEKLEYGTIKQRREHLELHIRPFIGGIKLSALTAPRIVAFLDELRDNGRSPAMRKKVLTNVKTLISFAQSRGLVAQNVARGVKLKATAREHARDMRPGVEMPTKAELRIMMGKAPTPRWRPFVVTAIFTGLRASELRGLRWEDVDLPQAVLHVRQRIDAWNNVGAPKSKAGNRDIPLAPMVVNALQEWSLACPKGELGLVFPNGQGKPESHSNIVNRFFWPLQIANGMVKEKGKAKYGLHALRHAAASLFIEQGWTPKKVQTVIGHASIQMTFDLYGKLFKDDEGDRQAMERMQAALLTG